MRFFGIAGHSGMGKTTLLERLIPELTGRGLRVSLIKHSHKDIEIDRPGKDFVPPARSRMLRSTVVGAGALGTDA